MTKEEAEVKLKESQRAQCEKFCPIILNNCKQNCVCFEAGRVYEATPSSYRVSVTYCSHSLIDNHIHITQE